MFRIYQCRGDFRWLRAVGWHRLWCFVCAFRGPQGTDMITLDDWKKMDRK